MTAVCHSAILLQREMKNPTATILLFISLTFTIRCATSEVIHDVQYLVGCFVNSTEIELTVDGDETFYVDFQRGELVFTYPPFVSSMVPSIFDNKHMFVNAGKNKRLCHDVLSAMTGVEKNPPEEQEAPDSFLYASEEVELGVENTLICYVRHFYPPSLQVSWSRNGEAVSGASLSRYFPDEDGTFHQFSSLDFIPHEGDEYSCSVTHPALDQPTVRFWDSEPEPVVKASSAADVVCAVGLTLGTLAAAGGMFLLVKSGRVCQPSEVL